MNSEICQYSARRGPSASFCRLFKPRDMDFLCEFANGETDARVAASIEIFWAGLRDRRKTIVCDDAGALVLGRHREVCHAGGRSFVVFFPATIERQLVRRAMPVTARTRCLFGLLGGFSPPGD
jgi:hypothetical protein